MLYTIRQTCINHKTGERRTYIPKQRWQTQRGAQRAAERCAWKYCPDGKAIICEYSAEVIPA